MLSTAAGAWEIFPSLTDTGYAAKSPDAEGSRVVLGLHVSGPYGRQSA